MQEWLRISILLCSFGFLKEVRPSEPFLTNYLLGDQYFNVTEEEVRRGGGASLCVVYVTCS